MPGSLLKKSKRIRGRPRSKSAPAAITLDTTKQKRKQWSQEEMQAALDKVRSGESVLRAAKLHGVPMSIHDRVSGRVLHGHKPGPDPYLSVAEEEEFADFLVTMAKQDNKYVPLLVCLLMIKEKLHLQWCLMDGSGGSYSDSCIYPTAEVIQQPM